MISAVVDVPRGTLEHSHASPHGIRHIPVHRIVRGRWQPRQAFDPNRLAELADSILASGVIQPIVVRPSDDGQHFELLAGERRWRAAQSVGLETIPAIVRDCPDGEAAVIALTENVQREDLNPIEAAEALRGLLETTGWTQDTAAIHLGRSRSEIAHHLRLLKLPDSIREAIGDGRLTLGHGKVLARLPITRAQSIGAQCVRREWTVARLARAVRATDANNDSGATSHRAELQRLERTIAEHIQAPTHVRWHRGQGSVTLDFHSLEAFDGFLERLGIRSED